MNDLKINTFVSLNAFFELKRKLSLRYHFQVAILW